MIEMIIAWEFRSSLAPPQVKPLACFIFLIVKPIKPDFEGFYLHFWLSIFLYPIYLLKNFLLSEATICPNEISKLWTEAGLIYNFWQCFQLFPSYPQSTSILLYLNIIWFTCSDKISYRFRDIFLQSIEHCRSSDKIKISLKLTY